MTQTTRWFKKIGMLAAPFFISGTLWAHGVKDPVCRMEVDTHATAYKADYKEKTYHFCSSGCKTRFESNPEQYVKVLEDLSKVDKTFEVQVKTAAPPVSGQPVKLTFTVVSGPEKTPVKSFEVVHEQLMHLVMASDDLDWFAHEHPTPKPDGTFDFTWTFPSGGRYSLYTDFTPADGDNQLLRSVIDVQGTPKPRTALLADSTLQKTIGHYRVELTLNPAPIQIEKASKLTYTIRDTKGKPVTDMEPYLGAMGHLFAVHQAGEDVVHTHASHTVNESAGPAFSFNLTLPREGLYKVWAQFSRKGKILTVPFVLEARPLWEKTTEKTGCNCGCKDCQKKHAEN